MRLVQALHDYKIISFDLSYWVSTARASLRRCLDRGAQGTLLMIALGQPFTSRISPSAPPTLVHEHSNDGNDLLEWVEAAIAHLFFMVVLIEYRLDDSPMLFSNLFNLV